MNRMRFPLRPAVRGLMPALLILAVLFLVATPAALAQAPRAAAGAQAHQGGGEASLKIPDLGQVQFGPIGGRPLLMTGLSVCVPRLGFGLGFFRPPKGLAVHPALGGRSPPIYETCTTSAVT